MPNRPLLPGGQPCSLVDLQGSAAYPARRDPQGCSPATLLLCGRLPNAKTFLACGFPCTWDQMANNPSTRRSASDILQELFSDDALPEPSFCNLCAAITCEAVTSGDGYAHVKDAVELNHTAETCDLCHLIVLGLIESARHGVAGEQILCLDAAIAEFESRWRGNGMVLPSPRPVVLAMSQSLPNILSIKTVFTSAEARTADRHHDRTRHAAYLILHGSGDIDQKPMVPRPDPVEMLTRLRIGLWGWTADRKKLSPIPEVKLPDRVLDLGHRSKEGKGEMEIRLVETADIPKGSYATLSYCWGGYRGFLTESNTYQDRCKGFHVEELPELFRHACFVILVWGIRYLWIDALCIIQDDRADWEKQAAQMADIYRNCAVRIAATAAKDPTCGFFPPEPIVTSVRLKQVETSNSDYRYSHEGKCFATLPKIYEKDVDLGRLNSRAWVVQERLLAPRTVHFCKDHIYLETDRWGLIGEDMVSQFELRYTSVSKAGINRSRLVQNRITDRSYDDNDDTSDSWQRIAELYSNCQTTFSTDRLTALGGLIQDRQTHGKFPYRGSKNIVGMWEPTLHEDLLWVSTTSAEFTFLQDLKLPTWAWISYQGPVTFLKDQRSIRDPCTMRTSPIREFELLDVTGCSPSTQLPLLQAVILSVKLKLAKIPALGRVKVKRLTSSHKDVTRVSPFRHWPGTSTQPIPLVAYDNCTMIVDAQGGAIGYMSMDTTEDPNTLDLWCAQIATLHDETYRGPDPLSRLHYAVNVDHIAAITSMGLGPEYKKTTDTHILTYCLIVSRQGTGGNEYSRHGIAEVQYEWMNRAPVRTISLI